MSNLLNLYQQINLKRDFLNILSKEFNKSRFEILHLLLNSKFSDEQEKRAIQIAQNILISNNQNNNSNE